MKLNPNEKVKSLDFTEEEDWARQIIERISAKIPIMTSIPKSDKTAHFSYIGLARHMSLAETIMYSRRSRFRNLSDVHRAAAHIGYCLLYQLTKGSKECTPDQKARMVQSYNLIQTMEGVNHNKQVMDDILVAINDLVDAKETGAIGQEEMGEWAERLLNSLPDKLSRVLERKIKRLANGDKFETLLEGRPGRYRKQG